MQSNYTLSKQAEMIYFGTIGDDALNAVTIELCAISKYNFHSIERNENAILSFVCDGKICNRFRHVIRCN